MQKEKEKGQGLSLNPGCSKDKQSRATERVTFRAAGIGNQVNMSKRREWSVGPHGAGDPQNKG